MFYGKPFLGSDGGRSKGCCGPARLAAGAVAIPSASMAYLLSHISPWMRRECKAAKNCQQSSGKGNLQVPSREFHPSAGPWFERLGSPWKVWIMKFRLSPSDSWDPAGSLGVPWGHPCFFLVGDIPTGHPQRIIQSEKAWREEIWRCLRTEQQWGHRGKRGLRKQMLLVDFLYA